MAHRIIGHVTIAVNLNVMKHKMTNRILTESMGETSTPLT